MSAARLLPRYESRSSSPEQPRFKRSKEEREIQAILASALNHLQQNEIPEAILLLESILERDPEYFEAQEHLRAIYRAQGDRLFSEKKYMKAARRYELGDAFTQVQRVLETVCRIADEHFDAENFKDAKAKYEDIQEMLDGLVSLEKLEGTAIADDFETYAETIKEKIEKCTQRIDSFGIAVSFAEVNQRLQSFENGRVVDASLEQLREYENTLLQIQVSYKKLSKKDARYSAPPRLAELFTQIHRSLELAETALLKEYSLKKADALETIERQCKRWMDIYEKLGKPGDLSEKRGTIERIQDNAELHLRMLSSSELESLASHALYMAQRARDLSASDKTRNNWHRNFRRYFSSREQLRNDFVSLTPSGHANFKQKLENYLKKHLVLVYCLPAWCSCCCNIATISAYPSIEDIKSWLKDCLESRNGCIRDIREELDPHYRPQEGEPSPVLFLAEGAVSSSEEDEGG